MPSWSKDGVVGYMRDFGFSLHFFVFKLIVVTNLKIDFHHCIYWRAVRLYSYVDFELYMRLKYKINYIARFYYAHYSRLYKCCVSHIVQRYTYINCILCISIHARISYCGACIECIIVQMIL